jgi:putative cardiolipin synthase
MTPWGRAQRALLACGLILLFAGCSTLPPGSDYPKTVSSALTRPEETRLGRELAAVKAQHPDTSGFKLLPVGIDSFLLRMQLAARRSAPLDVQYFLIQSDNTGQLLIEALLAAADRGVRVRVLLDDAGSFGRDAQVRTLAGYPNVELRLFNPFAYRGDVAILSLRRVRRRCGAAPLPHAQQGFSPVDNEIAIVGGRNVGGPNTSRAEPTSSSATTTSSPPARSSTRFRRASTSSGIARWRSRSRRSAALRHPRSDLDGYREVLAAHHAQMIEGEGAVQRRAEGIAACWTGCSATVRRSCGPRPR